MAKITKEDRIIEKVLIKVTKERVFTMRWVGVVYAAAGALAGIAAVVLVVWVIAQAVGAAWIIAAVAVAGAAYHMIHRAVRTFWSSNRSFLEEVL